MLTESKSIRGLIAPLTKAALVSMRVLLKWQRYGACPPPLFTNLIYTGEGMLVHVNLLSRCSIEQDGKQNECGQGQEVSSRAQLFFEVPLSPEVEQPSQIAF